MRKDFNQPCDRCGNQINGFYDLTDDGKDVIMTAGYYDMRGWEACRNEGENYVCDDCMHNDPRYFGFKMISRQ